MDAVSYDEGRLLAGLHEQLFPRHHIYLVHIENHSRLEWTSLCNHCTWALNILQGGVTIDEAFAARERVEARVTARAGQRADSLAAARTALRG
jgi:hypothetical protein